MLYRVVAGPGPGPPKTPPLRPARRHARRGDAHGLIGHGGDGTLQQLDVSFVLASHVRVLEEDRALAMAFQHAVGDLRITAHRAALVARHPFLALWPAAAPRQFIEALAGSAGADPVAEA